MAEIFHHYHVGLSQPSRAILLTLKVTNSPHEIHSVDASKGGLNSPEFLKMNPFHKVPVLKHGDFVLTESPAIARYILNTQKCEDHWYPEDPKKRARVDEYLSYQHTSVRKCGVAIAVNCVFIPKRTGIPLPEEEKKELLKNFDDVLTEFAAYFLKDGPYIAGEEVSIADIFAVSEFLQVHLSGIDFLASQPKVKEYVERVKAALQPHFDEVFRPLFDFVKDNVKK